MRRWGDALLPTCGAFLLAVLWMDLMFDVQVLSPTFEPTHLSSIAGYYRRVTIDAGALSFLIGGVMSLTILLTILQLRRSDAPLWSRVATFALVGIPIALALILVFPNAQELARSISPARQLVLAQRIRLAHLGCFASVSAFVGLQLAREAT